MTYEMFKEMVIQRIKNYLPDDWKDAKIERYQYDKVNFKKDSIVFTKTPGKGMVMSPNVDASHWYQNYLKGASLNEVLTELAEAVLEAERNAEPMKEDLDLDKIKDRLFCQLIHTEQNKELLKTLPHREFNDLSIIYVWMVHENNRNGICTAKITNAIAETIHMSEEELYQLAKENTQRVVPTVIKPMSQVINELMGETMPQGVVGFEPDEPAPMYVITNRIRTFGASAILFEDGLQELAENFGENFYILPSSVHECIAIPQSNMDVNELADMVYEINMTQVDLPDRLSNEVYQYDANTREVTLATDVPNKSLEKYRMDEELAIGVAVHAR